MRGDGACRAFGGGPKTKWFARRGSPTRLAVEVSRSKLPDEVGRAILERPS